MAAVTPHCPYIEYMPAELCDSDLRRDLVQDDMQIVDGRLAWPTKPGLGIELNPEALQRYQVHL